MHDDTRLDELISLWQANPEVLPEQLCQQSPELLPHLRERIEAIAKMNDFVERANTASLPETNDLTPSWNPSEDSTPFRNIASACASFTADWTPSARQSIEQYLGRVPEPDREALLRNLLRNEIKLRRNAGELFFVDEYVQRFPDYRHVVREVFVEASPLSFTGTYSPRTPKVTTTPELVGLRLGEYLILDQLGQGGMGIVYKAIHVTQADEVALKLLPQVDGNTLTQFKREFRSAADIHHPNLIGLHTLEADGNQWFFTMDLIEGTDFLSYVRPDDQLDEARLRNALGQLIAGVLALHGRHILHRDLKPSNVLVTHEGQVVILDFGLVVQLGEVARLQREEGIFGTPGYMAPEQAAGASITNAVDWYAVGVMLYEALCGQLPFTGSISKVLQDKRNIDPPALVADEESRADLVDLAMRLLSREPTDRPDAFETVKALASTDTVLGSVVTSSGERLFGRDDQFTILQDAFDQFQQTGQATTIFEVKTSFAAASSLL